MMRYPSSVLVRFQLVADPIEFKEGYIDLILNWLSGGHASIGSEEELRCDYELQYFQRRLLELDTEATLVRQAYYRLYQADLDRLQEKSGSIDTKGIPAHIQQEREVSWLANQQVRRREQYETDLEMVNQEYEMLKQQCIGEIDRAKIQREKCTEQ
jgi:hypothetical protein